jgi:hypothetical protein
VRGQYVGNIDVLLGKKVRSVAFRGDMIADTETETSPDQMLQNKYLGTEISKQGHTVKGSANVNRQTSSTIIRTSKSVVMKRETSCYWTSQRQETEMWSRMKLPDAKM